MIMFSNLVLFPSVMRWKILAQKETQRLLQPEVKLTIQYSFIIILMSVCLFVLLLHSSSFLKRVIGKFMPFYW